MDAHDLNTVAYPKLTQAQMAAFGGCSSATLKRYRDGERLFQAGDRDFGFFVVKSGRVEILDKSGDVPKTLTVHEPGQFYRRDCALDRRPRARQRRRARRHRGL